MLRGKDTYVVGFEIVSIEGVVRLHFLLFLDVYDNLLIKDKLSPKA